MRNRRLFIYCAGGQGREALKTARDINRDGAVWSEIFFVDDGITAAEINGVPVFSFSSWQCNFTAEDGYFHVSAGEPALRRRIAEKLRSYSLALESLIHPSISISPFHSVGTGVFIGEGVTLSDNLSIGRCACLNANSTIGHDSIIGDYATVSPGAIVSGGVTIGDDAYIGTGAIIRDEVRIGRNSIIGMGSLVMNDIPDGVVAYGAPCRVIRENRDGSVFKPSKMELISSGGGGVVSGIDKALSTLRHSFAEREDAA